MAFYFEPILTFSPSWPLPEAPVVQKLRKAAQALRRAGVLVAVPEDDVPSNVVPLVPKARL